MSESASSKMNKQKLISNLEATQAAIESVITLLEPEKLTQANTIGEWSAKDALAHITAWTARCITVLYQAENQQVPEDIDRMFDDGDALNAEDYELQKDRPAEFVFRDLRGAHRQLIKRLSSWKESELFDSQHFEWLRGQSVGQFIDAVIVQHAVEHVQQIKSLAS